MMVDPGLLRSVVMASRTSDKKWHVPGIVSACQWAIESGWGVHCPGGNPFGMKPRKGRNDPQQLLMTTEFTKGAIPPGGVQIAGMPKGYYRIPQPFRTFPDLPTAFDAHAELIATAPVYAPAMAALPDLDHFIDLMAAHYATDPLYASKLKAMAAHGTMATAFKQP